MLEQQPDTRKVSLEDLLRLKRAERPEPVFWDRFEQELRAKQLAAIVERRPWWQLDLSRLVASVSRLKLPLGATAVLTLTLIGVREYRQSHDSGPAQPASIDLATAAGSSADVDQSEAITPTVTAAPVMVAQVADRSERSQDGVVSTTAHLPAAVAPAKSYAVVSDSGLIREDSGTPYLSRMIPWIGEALDASTTALVSGVTRSLEPTLVGLRDAHLEIGTLPTSSTLKLVSSSDRVVRVEEPLAKVAGPADSQRARLATYVAAAFRSDNSHPSTSDRTRERAISRMSDDELYSSASRFGVAGASGGGLRLNF
ncbi:MAG TPA: hypothetical protein PLN52_19880 [Opitutaceae bacterium]|nr:hypothetical protein [Opitutaceae bacterium]